MFALVLVLATSALVLPNIAEEALVIPWGMFSKQKLCPDDNVMTILRLGPRMEALVVIYWLRASERRGHRRLAKFYKKIVLLFWKAAGASSWWGDFAKFGNTPRMMAGWLKNESESYLSTFYVSDDLYSVLEKAGEAKDMFPI